MAQALGSDWDHLPPALQAHYRSGQSTDEGHLDIRYPSAMQPVLRLLRCIGALVHRPGRGVATTVRKQQVDSHQHWQRTLRWADGQIIHFNTVWTLNPEGQLIEWVNPCLGLTLAPRVVNHALHYQGVCFVVRLGRWHLRLPEWAVLGHTTIVETALDERQFDMDFRLTHPWWGEVFRYAGRFVAKAP